MDGKNNFDEEKKISPIILKECKKMARRERYLYERDKGRLVRFDDSYTIDKTKSTLVEDLITARNIHTALHKALAELTADEYIIIDECFFSGYDKVNYSKLAEKHGISRQAYTRKLNRILKKLKKLFISYYV